MSHSLGKTQRELALILLSAHVAAFILDRSQAFTTNKRLFYKPRLQQKSTKHASLGWRLLSKAEDCVSLCQSKFSTQCFLAGPAARTSWQNHWPPLTLSTPDSHLSWFVLPRTTAFFSISQNQKKISSHVERAGWLLVTNHISVMSTVLLLVFHGSTGVLMFHAAQNKKIYTVLIVHPLIPSHMVSRMF